MKKNKKIAGRAYSWNRKKHRMVGGEEVTGRTPYAYNFMTQKVDRRYRVTEDGRVISFRGEKPQFLSQFPNAYGRLRVALPGAKNTFVHKLIWFSFAADSIMNKTEMPSSQVEIKTMDELAAIARDENRVVHHKDNNKNNNAISNLELQKRWAHLPYTHGLKYSDSMDADNEANIADFNKLKNCDEGTIFVKSTNTKTKYQNRQALGLSERDFIKSLLIKRDVKELCLADWQSGGIIPLQGKKENIRVILPDGDQWYFVVFFGEDGGLHVDRIMEQPEEMLTKTFVYGVQNEKH